jgi:hypothetical protein
MDGEIPEDRTPTLSEVNPVRPFPGNGQAGPGGVSRTHFSLW